MAAARPFLTADELMWQFFEPERRRLSELADGATMTERLRAALLEMLPAATRPRRWALTGRYAGGADADGPRKVFR